MRTASEISHLQTLGQVEIYYSFFFVSKGEWESAKAQFQKGIKYCEETKYGLLSAYSWSGLGFSCSMLEDSEGGKSHAEKGLAIYRESRVEVGLAWFYYSLGSVFFGSGRFKKCSKPYRKGTAAVSKK